MATIIQKPNEVIFMDFQYNSTQEQCVEIYRAGQLIDKRNTGDSQGGTARFTSDRNPTDESIVWMIAGLSKSRSRSDYQWSVSRERTIVEKNCTKICYDDYPKQRDLPGYVTLGDNDYDDIVVTVKCT